MSDFRKKTINGISWSVVSQISSQVITFVFGIVLARFLSPSEFGLIAMITVLSGFASLFAEMGLGAAIINKQTAEQVYLSSVFWLNITSGVLLTLLFFACASLIAHFYTEPKLMLLTKFVALNFLISAFGTVQESLLIKELSFRKLAYIEFNSQFISGVLAVTMAIMGYGVWSLAIRSTALSVIEATLLWRSSKWRPQFLFSWIAVKDISGFGLNLLGTKSLAYWVRSIDNLLIGRTLGAEPLGIYARAYAIMLLPLTMISDTISRSVFPSLSMIQNDKPRVKSIYLNITGVVALFVFPLSFGLFVAARSFVLTVYGTSWEEIVPIIQIFCVTSPILAIGNLAKNIYWSQGRTDLQFRVGLFYRTFKILAIVVGLRWGVLGIAVGFSMTTLVSVYIDIIFAGPLVDMKFTELLKSIIGPFSYALLMAVAVWFFGFLFSSEWPLWVLLTSQIVVGITVYSLLVSITGLQAYVNVRKLLFERFSTWQEHDMTVPMI